MPEGPRPFRAAIAQSGEAHTLTREDGAAVAAELARSLDVSRADAASLAAVPVGPLLAAQDQIVGTRMAATGVMPFAPAVDGELLDTDVLDAVTRGRGGDVTLVVGTTRDELRLFPDPTAAGLDDERLRRRAARLVPASDPADVAAAYRSRLGAAATNGDVWEALRTDARMRIPNLRLADARDGADAPTFVYRFDWAAPGLGAAHAVDVPFTFGTFDREGWGDVVGHGPDAEVLGATLRSAWAGVARHGTPSRPELTWPPYRVARRHTMLLDRACRVVEDPEHDVRVLYDA